MLRAYRGALPQVAASAYIDPSAQVIGRAKIGERSSVWPNVTIRADVNTISIGDESNIQDNSCLHCDEGAFALVIGNRVTVGHSVTLHGCVVEDDCLIGIGAVVLNGARIGRGSVIAAGALVPEGAVVAPASLMMGVPAKLRRQVTPEEEERFRLNLQHYIDLCRVYREEPA
jgi:carbonic anhydrase/acetyltransferase-like protein (isoleucine patch superfamily)